MAKQVATGLALIACALLIYAPALNGLPIWDDGKFLFENPLLLADDGLYRIWFTTENHDYWPLTYSWLWIARRMFGAHVVPYHLVNALLHGACGVLIWQTLRRMEIKSALVPAALFVFHPVNVEAVAWMFQVKTLLASTFGFAACLVFASGKRTWLVVVLFTAAMLSKTSAVVFPAVFLLMAAWAKRIDRRAWMTVGVTGAIGVALGIVGVWFHRIHYLVGTDVVRSDGVIERLLGAGTAVWFYLYKALVPMALSFVYPRWNVELSALWFLPLAALPVAAFVLYRLRQRAALYAGAFFVVCLGPVLGFVDIPFMQFSLVADHWQYPALLGPLLLTAAMDARIAGALALVLAGLTAHRASLFVNERAVYADAVKQAPDNLMVRMNYGKALALHRDLDGAIEQFSAAARIAPNNADAHSNLGSAYADKRDIRRAVESLERATALQPGHVEASYGLGNLLLRSGRFAEAAQAYQAVLDRDPDNLQAVANLGAALAQLGKPADARPHLEKAVKLAPANTELSINLIRVLAATGDYAGAKAEANRSLGRAPRSVRIMLVLGGVLAQQGQAKEAEEAYVKALQIASPEMRPQIMQALDQLRQSPEGTRTP